MSQGKIVLIACGSFSPPTYMHLRMFEIARDYIHTLGIGTVVGGLMSPVHDAYGKKDLVAANHRVSMLKLALRCSNWIKISEWETQQANWTRTKVSLQYHQDTINKHLTSSNKNHDPPSWLPDDIINVNSIDEPDNLMEKMNGNMETYGTSKVQVKLLCGADLLESFATPGLWSEEDIEAILGRHGLVVVSRSGSDPGKFIYESDLLHKYRRNVILVTNYVANEVSSTVLRRLVRRGDSAKYLTDDAVLNYIRQHRLYGATPLEHNEYNILNDKKSPQDTIMTSPDESKYKNILISIRDKPSIIDETITIKRQKTSNFLMLHSHTDSVSPVYDATPKYAYVDKTPTNYVPGKAVKIISDKKSHNIEDSDKVSFPESTHASLDSYLCNKEEVNVIDTEDLYKRRVSAGVVEQTGNMVEKIKKRCSASTIRKLNNKKAVEIKKSKSEVVKLCEKMKNVKIKDKESGRNYMTRSCNDIVKLVLTKHGIHVISDTEAIV